MESGRGHGGVMRGGTGGKKMRKRKELDALVGGVGVKRANGGGTKRAGCGGVSPQDQLLSESSGDEDYWSSAKGGSVRKKKNSYNSPHGKSRVRACTALLRLCTVLLVMACVVATITVMWLFIDIKEQTTYLRSQLDQVTAGNKEFPDDIQKCHTSTKQLEKNQTLIIGQLQKVDDQLKNFSAQIYEIQTGLSNLNQKLNDAPELITIPKTVRELTERVGNIRDQLADFNITIVKVSLEQKNLVKVIDTMKTNLSKYELLNKEIKGYKENEPERGSQPKGVGKDEVIKIVQETVFPNFMNLNNTLSSQIIRLMNDQTYTTKTINELKDDFQYCKSYIETIKVDQKDLKVTLNKLDKESTRLIKEVTRYMHEHENISEQMKNLTSLVEECPCHDKEEAKT